jgi:predicted transcriptional regulator of viral defense system
MIKAWDLRELSPTGILDYQQVMSLLGSYAKPRDRISAMLTKGELIGVRRGLYVIGDAFRRDELVKGQMANLIYGPSYVSLDYALAHHGMIPERVDEITSVTTGKHRSFETPFGRFTYRPLPPDRYAPGVVLTGGERDHFLIASPEKALADKVWCDKRFKPQRISDYAAYLIDDLRLDEDRLASLDRNRLYAIARAYSSRRIDMLARFLDRPSGSNP